MIKIPRIIPLSKAEFYAKKIAPSIEGGEIIALIGELGSGKTTFTKALGKELKIRQNIPSPTFVIMQEFRTGKVSKSNPKAKIVMYHLDLYRTKSFAEVKSLGITEWWGHPQTLTVIEWAEKIKGHLPNNTTYINLVRDTNDK
jgi:tRNA threonylcarbamoyladenosine biosynthesis protein TsaE